MTTERSRSALERYARAVSFLGPKLAAKRPGSSEEGYWIDARRFFFLRDSWSPELQRAIAIPAIADAETKQVLELLPLDSLLKVLSDAAGTTVSVDLLSTAEFDMPDPGTLAVSMAGVDSLVELGTSPVARMVRSAQEPALYSPDGRFMCALRGYDIAVIERSAGAERQLTRDGVEHFAYGRDTETNGGAIAGRAHPSPLGLWSSDSNWFITHRLDERSVPSAALIQSAPPGGGRPQLQCFKYPLPGDPIPAATLIAFHIPDGRCVEFNEFALVCAGASPFVSRRIWFAGPDTVWWIAVDRYSRRADLIRADLNAGTARAVLTETAPSGYLDLHPTGIGSPNVRVLTTSNEIIWYSERDGWGHLDLHDAATGALKNRITYGPWQVRDIVHVDERTRRVVFLAGGIDQSADPARRALCAVNLDGTGFEVLLAHDGDVFVAATEPAGLSQDRPYRPSTLSPGVSPNKRTCVVQLSNAVQGNRIVSFDLADGTRSTIGQLLPQAGDPQVRAFSCLGADRQTVLHGVLYLPSDFSENERYPLIDCIYPGPHVAHQPQSYLAVRAGQAMALAELGFVTLMLDTRGTPFGSRAFHQAGYGALLEPQLADHAAVIRALRERYAFIREDRTGIIGQSAGGAAVARALCEYGDLFTVGVAACGSHDASQVMTGWSDKYRGESRWTEERNTALAGHLRGKLLLISGDLDENVLLSQTLSLAAALIAANREFDLLIVPNAGHGVLLDDGYAQRRAWDYFVKHLQGCEPAREFKIEFTSRELTHFGRQFLREYR